MQYHIEGPTKITMPSVDLPTSKSISNRVMIINNLSYSPYEIKNLSDSDDTRVMKEVLTSNSNHFDIGAAGTSMRFLTAFLSKVVGEWHLTGSDRMKQRPIGILVDALNKLGAKIEYAEKEGYPPLRIFGSNLKGGRLQLQGNVSSQFISAILMIAPTIEDGLELELTGDIISRPYINLTLNLMAEFGVKSQWKGNVIKVPEMAYTPTQHTVESDWSGASYWYELLALAPEGEVVLKGLKKHSNQGDSKVAELFEKLGIKTRFSQKGTTLIKTDTKVKKFTYDFIDQPDLTQTFAVTCCFLNIPFKFTGLQTLKIKETDRIQALITELGKFGFKLTTNDIDTLEWNGDLDKPSTEKVCINTYEDHRMALAFAPAALVHGQFTINEPNVIGKSYPKYWEHLKMAGFTITEQK